jgi:hypothetical protein
MPMKRLLPFAFLLLTVTTAIAQSPAGWRLSSFALERYDGFNTMSFKAADSAVYHYSGNRLGMPSFEWLEGILRSASYRANLYNINPELQYDSVRTYRGSSTQAGYSDANLVYAQALNNTIITGRTRLSSGNVTAQETYTYNGSNLLTESEAQGLKTQYRYNSNNLPDTVTQLVYNSSTQSYVLANLRYYIYDGNNNLLQMQRINKPGNDYLIYDYTYNTSNLPEYVMVTQGGIMPMADTLDLWAYTYTTGNDLATELRRHSNGPGGIGGDLEEYDLHLNTYDNNHQRLEDMAFSWNKPIQTWDTFSKWTYTYTQAGLPETFASLRWDYTASKWAPMQDTNDVRTSHRMRLHYDIVWPVGISPQLTNTSTIQLYPNPAGEVLTFRISMETAQPFTASIIDMQGRVLMQWKEAATPTYTRTIPTATLPAGTYVLRVDGATTTSKTFVVNK